MNHLRSSSTIVWITVLLLAAGMYLTVPAFAGQPGGAAQPRSQTVSLAGWELWVGGLLVGLALLSAGFALASLRQSRRRSARLAQAEQAQDASETRYRMLAENIKDVIWILDLETFRFRYVSPSVQRLRGYTPEEIMAEPMDAALLPEAGAGVRALARHEWAEITAGRIPAHTFFVNEVEQPCKDGSTVWTEVITSYQTNPQTGKVEILGVTRDISARRKAEAALRESEALLRVIAENYPHSYISIIEKDLTVGFTSGAEFKKRGLDPQQFVGLTLEQVFGAFAPTVREHYLRTFAGEERTFELLFDGQYQRYRTVPLAGADGFISRILSVVENVTPQKQVEIALRESEERFRSIAEQTPDVVYITDAQGRITYLSPAFKTMFGVEPAEAQGRRFMEWLAPEEIGKAVAAFRDTVESGRRAVNLDLRMRRADGSTFFGELNGALFRAGDFVGASGVIRDISARKETEEKLRESETRFSTIFHASPIGVCLTNIADGRVEDVNDAFLKMFGYSRAEVIGRTTVELGMWGESADRQRIMDAVRRDHGIRNVELPFQRKSGERGYLLTSAELVEIGGRQLMLSMLNDITERKQLELDRQKFLLIAESSSEFIGMCDLDMQPLYVNPAGQRMVGLPDMATACRVKVQDYFYPEDQQFIAEEFFPRVLRDGHGDVEIRLRHFQTGEPIWMFYYLFSVRDASGSLIGWATVSRDITERKLAEQAIREAEERLHFALEKSHTGGWDLDLVDHTAFRTLEHDRIFGYESLLPEWTYEMFLEHILPEDRADVDRRFQAAIATQTDWYFECRIRRVDGAVRWIWATGGHQVDAYGQARRMAGIVQDITERKLAAEALREAEERLRFALEKSNIGSWDLNLADHTAHRSPVHARIFGYESNSGPWSSAAFLNHVIPEDRDEVRRSLQQAPATQGSLEFECRIRRVDGEVRWIWATAGHQFDAHGKPQRLVGILQDITERKLAAEALARSEARLRLAQEAAKAGAWEWNLLTNENSWSDELFRLYGLEPGQVQPSYEAWREAIRPEDRAAAEAAVQQASSLGIELNTEWRVNLPDGAERWLMSRGQPVRDAAGRLVAYRGIVIDITERKQREKETERLQSQLTQAQKMESVGRLAGGVAHDFNNMLQAILGYTDLSLEMAEPDSTLHDFLTQIRKAAGRSADLTRQLLAFARRQTIQPVALDMNDAVSGMLKMLRRLIGEDIHLMWAPGPALWKVRMDPSQLDQILANLAVNARDAIAGVGRLTIETANVTLDEDYCRSHAEARPGHYVLLTVSDSGAGMSKEIMSHIFEPFFTTKEVGKGTGLGLATVFGIVKQNHGSINVYSEPGQGTSFKIYLPRFEPQSEEPAAAEPAAPAPQRGAETVLIVEDEPAILRLGQRVLQDLGYTVLTADSPSEALRVAAEFAGPIHVLISDVILPEMNGRQLAEKLTALKPGLRCVYMSGYTANVIAHHGILDEGVLFVPKPFTAQSLAQKVRQALDQA